MMIAITVAELQQLESQVFDLMHAAQAIAGDAQDLQQEVAKLIVAARNECTCNIRRIPCPAHPAAF